MTEKYFWDLIEKSIKKCDDDEECRIDDQIDYLVDELNLLSDEDIIGFENQLREKLLELYSKAAVHELYTIIFSADDVTAPLIPSDEALLDSFLYFRAWLVAGGKELYQSAVEDPEKLSDSDLVLNIEECSAETLLYAADDALIEIHNDESKSAREEATQQRPDLDYNSIDSPGLDREPDYKDLDKKYPGLSAKVKNDELDPNR